MTSTPSPRRTILDTRIHLFGDYSLSLVPLFMESRNEENGRLNNHWEYRLGSVSCFRFTRWNHTSGISSLKTCTPTHLFLTANPDLPVYLWQFTLTVWPWKPSPNSHEELTSEDVNWGSTWTRESTGAPWNVLCSTGRMVEKGRGNKDYGKLHDRMTGKVFLLDSLRRRHPISCRSVFVYFMVVLDGGTRGARVPSPHLSHRVLEVEDLQRRHPPLRTQLHRRLQGPVPVRRNLHVIQGGREYESVI